MSVEQVHVLADQDCSGRRVRKYPPQPAAQCSPPVSTDSPLPNLVIFNLKTENVTSPYTEFIPARMRAFIDEHGAKFDKLISTLRIPDSMLPSAPNAPDPDPEISNYIADEDILRTSSSLIAEGISLRLRSRREVWLAGVDSDKTLIANAVGLADRGYTVKIPTDLCASNSGPEFHYPALSILRVILGTGAVQDSSALLKKL